jgi:hypothetical protein
MPCMNSTSACERGGRVPLVVGGNVLLGWPGAPGWTTTGGAGWLCCFLAAEGSERKAAETRPRRSTQHNTSGRGRVTATLISCKRKIVTGFKSVPLRQGRWPRDAPPTPTLQHRPRARQWQRLEALYTCFDLTQFATSSGSCAVLRRFQFPGTARERPCAGQECYDTSNYYRYGPGKLCFPMRTLKSLTIRM